MSTINGGNVSSHVPAGRRHTAGRTGGRTGEAEALVTSDGAVWTWAQLIEEFGPAVHSYARARGVTDADDLVQDVFTAVVQRVPTFCGSSAELRSFVFTVAFRRVADRHRRAYRHQRLWREPAALVEQPDESVLDDDDGAHAIAALDRLDERSQAVLRLRFIDERDITEIAALMNLSATNVRAIQSRALKRLRERFQGLSAGVHHGSSAVLAWWSALAMRRRVRPAAGAWARRLGVVHRVRGRMLGGAFGLGDAGVGAAGGASLVAAVSLTAASILGAGGSTATERDAGIVVVATPRSSVAAGTTPVGRTSAAQVLSLPGAPEPYVEPLAAESVGAGVPVPPVESADVPVSHSGETDPSSDPRPDDPEVGHGPGTVGGDSLADRLPVPDVFAGPAEVVDGLGPVVLAGSTDALPAPVTGLVSATAGATVPSTIDAPSAPHPPTDSTVAAAPTLTAAPTPAPAIPDVGLTVIDLPVAGELLP
jgi:RNA polymerase sigma-70 factor (ECF subfamily)